VVLRHELLDGLVVVRFWFLGLLRRASWVFGASSSAASGFWGSFVARSVVGSFVARDGLKSG
jgi:hypothetical protein